MVRIGAATDVGLSKPARRPTADMADEIGPGKTMGRERIIEDAVEYSKFLVDLVVCSEVARCEENHGKTV
jgi:hypothetical protein